MKLGILDIKKAYIGLDEVNFDNAFIGVNPLLSDDLLPAEYCRVNNIADYNGTCYIDLDLNIDSGTNLYIDAQIFSKSNSYHTDIFGYSGSADNFVVRYDYRTPYNDAFKCSGASGGLDCDIQLLTDYIIEVKNKQELYVNGSKIGNLPNYKTTPSYPCYLMASYGLGDSQPYAIGHQLIRRAKFWSNKTLVSSLVPCYRKSDYKPGMYDTVRERFFTNDGTGEFIVDYDLTYISGDANNYPYIVTPYAPQDVSKMIMKFSATRYNENGNTNLFTQDYSSGSYTNLLELYPWNSQIEINPWVTFATLVTDKIYYYEMNNDNGTYSAQIYDEEHNVIISGSGRTLNFPDKNILLLNARALTGKSNYSRIHNLQFYDFNDILMANYIPYTQNNQGCLLDTVSHQIIGNSGSGTISFH